MELKIWLKLGMRNFLLGQFRHRLSFAAYRELKRTFGKCLPARMFTKLSVNHRNRRYTLAVTFWAFLGQVFEDNASCQQAAQKVQALLLALRGKRVSVSNSAYCQARARLPFSWLRQIHSRVVEELEKRRHAKGHAPRRVCVVDSTTTRLPDTAANRQRYRKPSGQKPGCGFPVMKICALFSLATGAVLQYVTATFTVHDSRLLLKLRKWLRRGDILLADRAFCSYACVAELKHCGVDVVFRLHQARHVTRGRLCRLAKNDHLLEWKKPVQRPKNMSLLRWRSLPAFLILRQVRVVVPIRGFRTRVLYVVTTLCDPDRYSTEELAQLFRKRWQVELYFRDIKTSMAMEELHCRCPAMVHKELAVYLIAYNLIRWLMAQAATRPSPSTAPISFMATVGYLRHCAWLAHLRARLLPALLELISSCRVRQRPNRSEPRAVKRRPKPYQYLSNYRHLMKTTIHRDKYRKPCLS